MVTTASHNKDMYTPLRSLKRQSLVRNYSLHFLKKIIVVLVNVCFVVFSINSGFTLKSSI